MKLGEFVRYFAARLTAENIEIPFRDERTWHELLYELKSSGCHGESLPFVTTLRFDWDGPYPKSRELSEFLHALHWNASVSANNPHYDKIMLTESVAQLWNERAAQLDSEGKAALERAIEIARRTFRTPSA